MPMGGNSSGAAAGDVKFWPASSAPAGWLKANGAAVSRTTYAALFLVIGTTYGAGDGSTTFNVPDLRGEFVRAWDDGKGVDIGRVLGAAQGDAFKIHNHTITQQASNAGTGGMSGVGYGAGYETSYVGGNETRPRNVAMLACIKY